MAFPLRSAGVLVWTLCFAASAAGAALPPRDSLVLCDDVSDPVTLDPHRLFENKSYDIALQIFEGLLRFDVDGGIVPALAEECRQVDALTLRCTLRRGVKFHNGEPFDAEAVRWSLSRQLAPQTGYPAAMELSSIKEVKVVEPYVVEIRTSRPDGLLLHRLTTFVKILPPRYFAEVGAERFAEHPIGTGPFRFVRWEKGKSIELAANEDYWQKGLPRLKKVVFRFEPADKQLGLLFDGTLDLVTEIPATKTYDVVKNERTKIVKRLVLSTPAFWFTSFAGPLADRRVRQALNRAINKEQLIHYAVLGNGKPIATLSMEGELGHNEELQPYPYSPETAKKLLAEAGYAKGLSLNVLTTDQSSREAKILAEQWREIGVKATLTVLPLSDVHRIMAQKQKEFDVSANLAPDPVAHMYFLAGVCFYSRSLFSRLKSPEFDRLFEELVGTVDATEQLARAKRLDAWILEEALGVFTYQKIRTFALKRDMEIKVPATGILDLREAYWGTSR